MTTKFTVTIEKATLNKAKQFAQKKGTSLSQIIGEYLENITTAGGGQLPGKIQKLYGAISLPADLDHKKEIRRILSSKKK